MDIIFIIYFTLCLPILLICAKLSYKFNFLDMPNERKLHDNPTAYTGGIGISIIYLLSLKFFNFYNLDLNVIISISFLIAVVGLIDDKFRLNTGGKLSLQILPIFYLIFIEKIHLVEIGDYAYFKTDLESFAAPFTLLCVLFAAPGTSFYIAYWKVERDTGCSVLLFLLAFVFTATPICCYVLGQVSNECNKG